MRLSAWSSESQAALAALATLSVSLLAVHAAELQPALYRSPGNLRRRSKIMSYFKLLARPRKSAKSLQCIPDCKGEDPLQFTTSAVDLHQLVTQLQPALICTLHDK